MKKTLSIKSLLIMLYIVLGIVPIGFECIMYLKYSSKFPEDLRNSLGIMLIFFIAWVVAGIIIQYIIASRFSKGVTEILNTANEAQKGNLLVKAKGSDVSELSKLSEAFNNVLKQFHDVMVNVFVST